MNRIKPIFGAIIFTLFLFAGVLTGSGKIYAQGTVHVTVTGIPPLLPSPAISDFITAYESGMYSMQVIYSSPNQIPVLFRIKIGLFFNGLPVMESLSQPFELRTGAQIYSRFSDNNDIIFNETLTSLLSRLPSQLRDAADRGVFQEGLYQLTFELVPDSPAPGIVSIPSNVFFSVQYAQAPVLFAPGDGSVVAQPQPIFSWTPVTVPASIRVEYELEIAEIIGDQTPLQAIEGSTYPVVRTTIADQTIFIHTQEYLPYEPGKRYAWRVTAGTANNNFPFTNNGRSQIQVFDYMEAGARREHFRNLTEIIIEPGFARLTNFQQVRFREDGFAYSMNGPSTVELTTESGVIEIPVELTDLMIQKTGLENAILMGGQFDGGVSDLSNVAGMPDIIFPDRLKWAFGQGFSIEARIELPNGLRTPLAGTLRFGSSGFSGELYSTQNPIFELIDDGRGIVVNGITARFPGGQISASGEVMLFDGSFRCPVQNIILDGDGAAAYISCSGDDESLFSTVQQPGFNHSIRSLSGYLASDYGGNITLLDLNMQGRIEFDALEPTACSISTEFNIGTDSFELIDTTPRCVSDARINLGFGEVRISRLRLNRLSWNAADGWETEIEAAADVSLAFNPGSMPGNNEPLRLPEIDPIIINEKGIRFPDVQFDEFDLAGSPRFGMGELRVKVKEFKLPGIGFGWDEITRHAPELPRYGKPELPGAWEFEMEGDMEFGTEDLPEGPFTGPECLRGAKLTLTNGRFSNGNFSGSVDAVAGGETGICTYILAGGSPVSDPLVLEVRSIGGDVTGAINTEGFTTTVKFKGDSRITGGPYIRCSDGRSAAEGRIDITPRGDIKGTLNITGSGGCDLPLGPYHATLTEGTLVIETVSDSVAANLSAGVSVRFTTGNGDTRTATGTFRADLVKPEIQELDITLQGPIVLNFPEDEPVLQFVLDEARLTPDGLRLAGNQSLKTDGINIDTRFEDVLITYTEPGIASGRIIIDDGLTLLVDLTDNPGIRFRVREYNSRPEDMKFAALMLEGPISIDSSGIALNGIAHGALRLGHADLPDLQVMFKDDFRLQPDPFKVVDGRAEFIYEDTRIAWLDRDGLHADPSFFQHVAPERILLPVEQVAFIDLKEDGEWLLELEPREDGRIGVSTIPGRQARLSVPALQGMQPEPPSYPFTIDNVLLDPMTMSVVEGTITVIIPEQNGTNLTTLGIPLQLRKIVFGDLDYGGVPVRGLHLEGDLHLFDTQMRSTGPARLMILADGTIEGHIRLTGDETGFNITDNGYVHYTVTDVEGTIRIPAGNAQLASWDLFIDGEFEVRMNGEPSASAYTSLRYQPGLITVNAIGEGSYSGSSSREMEGFFIRVDRINTLSLSYSTLDGFDFYSNTDLTFGFRTKEEIFTVPVSGVALYPEGFSIPEQERHMHSNPPLNLPAFVVDGIRMKPIASRIPAIEVTWANFDSSAIPGFLPRFDFEITFPGFRERSPQLADATMTLADAGFTDGILSGSLLPYTFSDDGVPVPLSSPSLNPPILYVKTIGGGIRRIDTPSGAEQKFEFTFAGRLRNLPSFRYPDQQGDGSGDDGSGRSPSDNTGSPSDPDDPDDPNNPGSRFESCVEPELTIGYVPPMGFEAILSDVKPCGRLQMGPVGVEVDRSEIIFTYDAGTQKQSLHLEGDVSIYLPHPQEENRDTRIAGVLGLDLMDGTIREGSVEITEEFRWYLPEEQNKLFVFGVTRARLDMEGLTLQGEASLLVENDPLSVLFEEFRYDFQTRRFKSGRAIINSSVGIEIELSDQLDARLVDPDSPFTATNAIRLTSEGTAILDFEGLKLTGSSIAALRLGENDYPSITVVYEDEGGMPFTLQPHAESMPPVKVIRGRADLMFENSRIAWYDKDGIHFDDVLAALPIPDRIGLPSEEIAYLQLRDDQNELLVETQNNGSGYTLRTKAGKQVELVLRSFDEQNPPRIQVGFNLEVNDAFQITGGRIEVDLEDTPIDMQPFTGIPIRLVSLKYEMKDEIFRLMADARLRLPRDLEEIELTVHELRFGPRGFEQVNAEIGRCTEQFDPNLEAIASRNFGNGETETFSVMGVRLFFGDINGACISGTLTSAFLSNSVSDKPAPLFYRALWEIGEQDGSWSTRVEFTGGQDIPVGEGTLTVSDIEAIIDQYGFNVVMSGQLKVPEVMGSSFIVTVEDLSVGTNGVSVKESTVNSGRQFNLFNGIVRGNVDSLSFGITPDRVLNMAISGTLVLFDHPMKFDELKVGTDGSFSIDRADLLPGDETLEIIKNTAWLDSISISVIEKRLRLSAGGSVKLPDPINATGSMSLGFSVAADDSIVIHGPEFGLTFGSAGSSYTLGESSLTEIKVGTLATLAPTGIYVKMDDLYDITKTTLYATAILFIENDNGKRINFGDSGDIKGDPGIRITRESIEWSVSSKVISPNTELFSFDVGFFRLGIRSVITYDKTVFGLEISGSGGIVINGDDNFFAGTAGFRELRIAMPKDPFCDSSDPGCDLNPIVQWPTFDGLSLTIKDIINLEVGVLDFGIASEGSYLDLTIVTGDKDDPENITEEIIQVKEFLRFYNPLGGSAISISLTDAFSGGVEEILIYRDKDDKFALYIKNAHMGLASVGTLNINFRLVIGPGEFTLFAAGGGYLTGVGGMAAAGKFSVIQEGNQTLLSFGVMFFIRSDSPIPFIPQVPPAIGLTRIGGGFFFRPTQDDMRDIYTTLETFDESLGFMMEKRGLPPASANFVAMLYAGFAMVGQGPINAFEGVLFMELTDNYVNVIAYGDLVKQTGRLTAGMTATLNWSNLSLSGRLAAKIDYNPAVYGDGDLGFTLAINVEQKRLDWVVDGGFQANLLGIPATGSMVVSPAGFYAELGLNANYSLLVVSLDGNFTARNWVIPDYNNPLNSEIGAFAQVDFKVDLFLASVNAVANGTFVIKNQEYSLYMLAELSADIIGTEGAAIWAFAELKNNRIVAADILYEVDENIARLISEAGDMANEMNEKANDAKTAVENATGVFDTKLSDDILAQAGENYLNFTNTALGRFFAYLFDDSSIKKAESYLYSPNDFKSVRPEFQWVDTNIKTGIGRPDDNIVKNAFTQMNDELRNANQTATGVQQLIDETRAKAVEWVVQSQQTIDTIEPPVTFSRQTYTTTSDGITINSSIPFSVDMEKAGNLSGEIEQASEIGNLFEEQVGNYLDAIDDAVENLSRLNAILHGSGSAIGIIAQGNKYIRAREAVGEYFARRANYFHENYHWANTKHEALKAEESNIRNAVLSTIQRYQQMEDRTAANRCEDLERELLGSSRQFNVDCTDRYGLAQVVAMVRRKIILRWSGLDNNAINTEIDILSTAMHDLRSEGYYAEFNNRYRETGDEYWFEMLDLGFVPFKSNAAQRAIETNNQRISTLSTIVPAHRTFTQSLDSLYVLKARMVENLYAMSDAFLHEYERAGLPMNDSRIIQLQNRRSSYANMLLPATISSLTVKSQLLARTDNGIWHDQFINRSTLKWSGVHPVRVSEYSLGIIRGHQNNIPSTNLFSTGNADSYLHWTYRGYQDAVQNLNITTDLSFGSRISTSFDNTLYSLSGSSEPTIDFTATVRARGEAGYTSSRSIQFQALVEKPDNFIVTQLTGLNPGTTTVAPTTNTLPTTPILTLNGATSHNDQEFSPSFWWFETGRLDVTLISSDAGSGIQRFEMAVGSTSTTRDLMPWTRVTGTRESSGNTVTLHAIIRNLNLITGGTGNYIHIRSVNNEGRYSNATVSRVFVDQTPPVRVITSPAFSNPLRSDLYSGDELTSTTTALTSTRTFSFSGDLLATTQNPSSHNITVPVFSDPESGIPQVQYVISSEARLPLQDFDQGYFELAESSTIEAPTSFRDSSYVYFRALNGASMYSDIVTVAYKTTDLTRPTTPQVRYSPVLDGLKLEFTTPSSDPETGVKGVVYAIGSGPGLADIKAWPEGNEIDFVQPVLQTVTTADFSSGSFTILDSKSSIESIYPSYLIRNDRLPMDRTFYVTVRTLNGQNLRSGISTSGALYISRKPPEFENISVTGSAGSIQISGNVADSVGITRISYTIRDSYNGDLIGEGDLYGPVPYSSSGKSVSLAASVDSPDNDWRHSLKVLLTAENAAGLIRNLNQDILINPDALQVTPAPTNVGVSSDNSGNKTVSWSKSLSPYMRRYEIIMKTGNDISVIGETDAASRAFTFKPASGDSSIQYGVRAVNMQEVPSPVAYPMIILISNDFGSVSLTNP